MAFLTRATVEVQHASFFAEAPHMRISIRTVGQKLILFLYDNERSTRHEQCHALGIQNRYRVYGKHGRHLLRRFRVIRSSFPSFSKQFSITKALPLSHHASLSFSNMIHGVCTLGLGIDRRGALSIFSKNQFLGEVVHTVAELLKGLSWPQEQNYARLP